jgi:hypothetical protein
MPHLWHVEPPLRSEQAPFDSAMRRKSGSRIDLSRPETSCYAEQNNDLCSVTSFLNDMALRELLTDYLEILMSEVLALVAENSPSNAGQEARGRDLAFHPAQRMLLCSKCRNDIAGSTGSQLPVRLGVSCPGTGPSGHARESLVRLSANRMRHGTAAGRRHVAPAVLLC